MPSPNTLRALEDRWMDNDANATGVGSDAAGAGGGGVGDDERGALRDLVWGVIMGFFWPVGCGVWLVREEGVWSFRRKAAVAVGFGLNLVLGVVRFAI
jgi:iron-sulfur cluster assembly 1